MASLRILSLLPAATEIVYLLGLEKSLVGVSHECDYPPQVKNKPKVTSSSVSNEMSSLEIDRLVGKLVHQGPGVFHIKKDQLKKLKPDLIITQELCQVCAIPFTQVQKAARFAREARRARILEGDMKIISLEPESVEDILDNIRVVGEFGGKKKEAIRVVRDLRERIRNLKLEIRNSKTRPRVLVVEWLDPVMVAGHWVPEMVELAGGMNLITKKGEKSRKIKFGEFRELGVDILIISPCGFDIKRTLKEKKLISEIVRGIRGVQGVYLVDGNSYMTRPGPRIVDGIEILSEIIHPEIYPRRQHPKEDWMEFIFPL